MNDQAVTPVVIKLSGKALCETARLEALMRVLHEGGAPFVLVHGGGVAVDALMKRLGLEVRRVRGLRVSPAEDMPVIAGALAGTCGLELRGAAVRAGLMPLGLAVTDGGLAELLPEDPELGRVAKTRAGREEAKARLLGLLAAGWLPVISSVGIDAEGRLWNVNADDAAVAVAGLLGSPLVFLSDVRGVLDAEKSLIPTLTEAEAARLEQAGVITAGMAVKVHAAFEAGRVTGAPVAIALILDESAPAAILAGGCPGTTCAPGESVEVS